MDAANQLLAEAFLDVTYLDAANGLGAPASFLKATKSLSGTIQKIHAAVQELTNLEPLEWKEKLPDLIDEWCLCTGVDQGAVAKALSQKKSVLLDLVGTFGTTAGALSKIDSFLKALAASVAMSDAQMEMIQAIIDTQPSGSLLYRGMTRLYNQLSNGYISYFTSTYLTDQVYNQVANFLSGCPCRTGCCYSAAPPIRPLPLPSIW